MPPQHPVSFWAPQETKVRIAAAEKSLRTKLQKEGVPVSTTTNIQRILRGVREG